MALRSEEQIATNDLALGDTGAEAPRIAVVTGSNSGGNTTVLEAVGLTQVLAQVRLSGCGLNDQLQEGEPASGVSIARPRPVNEFNCPVAGCLSGKDVGNGESRLERRGHRNSRPRTARHGARAAAAR